MDWQFLGSLGKLKDLCQVVCVVVVGWMAG